MHLITSAANKIMPWKNGLGTTREIDISPLGADFASGNFDYRLSSATVASASEFSKFPGFDRILCVIQGSGISINQKFYKSFEPFRFEGETEIIGTPTNGEITDVGLIFRRDRFTATMARIENSETIHLNDGIHYLFCVQGQLRAGTQILQPGDTLKVTQNISLPIAINTGAVVFQISLKAI